MKLIKNIEIKLSHMVSKSPNLIYNNLRFIRNILDKVIIEYNFLLGRPFLLVYQQGRVASTSVFESLSLLNLPYVMFHIHYLDITKINTLRDAVKDGERIDRHLIVGEMLSKKISHIGSNSSPNNRWKIVSIVREPISLILSTLFLNTEKNFNDCYIDGTLNKELVLEKVSQKFITEDPNGWNICKWFENELSKSLHIDIYNNNLNPKDSYLTLNGDKVDVLVLKYESLENSFKKGVSDFLGVREEDAVLLHSNPHIDKKGKDIQKYVTANLKLPKQVCRNLYSSCGYVKQFYSSDMINDFINKWSEK